jgi:hypothetical protein
MTQSHNAQNIRSQCPFMAEAVEKLAKPKTLNIGDFNFARDRSPKKVSVLASAAPGRCFTFFNRSLPI